MQDAIDSLVSNLIPCVFISTKSDMSRVKQVCTFFLPPPVYFSHHCRIMYCNQMSSAKSVEFQYQSLSLSLLLTS